MPKRRRRPSRQRSGRIRWGPLIIAALILLVIVYAAAMLNRQIKGYFVLSHHGKRIAQATAAPEALPSPVAPPESSVPVPSASPATPGPRLAIIIDDCGYSLERDRRFVALPIPLTLSILPMTPHGKEIAQEAESAGKFVMLHIPMEPESPDAHPGPGAITTSMSDDQIQSQLQTDIESLPPVPGANNHMGSKATSDPRVMHDVIGVLHERHLFFIDSLTSGSSVGLSTAQEAGVPTAARDVFLDNSLDLKYIEGQLRQAKAVALKNGTAIAIGHPNVTTAQALTHLIPEIEAAGITFVPAQSLVH